ncbi:helix-turn-helix transcriptional regulator [Cupriavidus sp. BIC8F]|uniref:helix-turn-helix domain-containing protein n=1 Tax=Cupriavidus sp. BIC8F TaxID=3079014 RepID=UPI002916EE9B|nr:helix-turn-helix transcriptional regulator [Cupriavidus sp. BIC8F]
MNKLNTPKKPALQDWHRADIKGALEKAGYSLRQLSIQHGYSQGALKNALYLPWPVAERIIAAAIGLHASEIWPTRYDADGNPKSGRHQRGLGRGAKRKSISQPSSINVESTSPA